MFEHTVAVPRQPAVSVIIPAYNSAPYIAETIGSVLDQTFDDLELIVVDDGSADDTPAVVTACGPRVRLIIQANAGVCAARNRGIREAAGRYLCLLDHDDYWFPDKLQRQVTAMQEHPDCGVIYSPYIPWVPDAAGRFPAPDRFDLAAYGDGIDAACSGWIYHLFLLDCCMLTSTSMFRREVFDRCGGFDEALPYSEDWELWLRISREFTFVKLRRPDTLYRQHPQQGNRVVRPLDYRTLLLRRAMRTWGLCSPDGRCVPRGTFLGQLAEYQTAYALGQLRAGHHGAGLAVLARAWATRPRKVKFLAYLAAALVGWRPK
jgi:glycosyltransferase involved in cell wall biosynthesis